MYEHLVWQAILSAIGVHLVTGLDKHKFFSVKLYMFLTHQLKHMFWVLIKTVLLSTNNICFGGEIRKLNFRYALLTKSWPGSTD